MKTLVVYATHTGCARKAAERLRELLGEGTAIADLGEGPVPDLAPFDAVVVGGSIRAGRVQRRLRAFCDGRSEELLGKRLGLYLCCMYEGDVARKQLEDAFPAALRARAAALGLFGGELDLGKIGFAAKLIVRKVAGVTESVFRFDGAAVERFARELRG